ncbi:HAD family hydrolase [candidate division KSB1 bacterium]|nr:HAD family hydrolase [candidate division KSB1 bacterium]
MIIKKIKFNIKKDFLALDFDGVIADSVEECLLVAHNAYSEHTGGIRTYNLSELDPVLISEFKRLRKFIRSGADFVFIIKAITEKINIDSQLEFDDYITRYKDSRKIFFDLFYMERERFSVQMPDIWILFNPLYDGMKEFLINYPYKERLFIITTKKIFYVGKIFFYHNIQLPRDNLFTATEKNNKKDIILQLLHKYNISPKQFWFIDDQIDTLLKVKDTRINCMLAEWGYTEKQQINRGKKENIHIITLKNFSNKFIPEISK